MGATVGELRQVTSEHPRFFERLRRNSEWRLGFPFQGPAPCYHGGAFFEAIGPSFDGLERSREIINADVLDAWFPPAPSALAALREHLPWLARTSPPRPARA